MMSQLPKKKLKYLLVLVSFLIFHLFGGFRHLLSKDFNNFDYPYNGNVKFLVDQMMTGAEFTPINYYYIKYKSNLSYFCERHIDLLFLVKSAPENYARRDVIRRTWGSSNNNKHIKTVFLIGERPLEMSKLDEELANYKDLLRGNFSDNYFNNTIKTMMGFKWAYKHCSKHVDYFMFVDDDYYVSPKNVLRFAKNPSIYPGRDVKVSTYSFIDFSPDKYELYGGYVFNSSPFRSYFSKWFVSLSEYPYNKWPPYVTAGAYVLTKLTLKRMYLASLLTQHFRFDDIYVGILAYKLGLKPVHNDNFYFNKHPHDVLNYRDTVASHGYGDPRELWKVWNEQNHFNE